MSKFIFDYQINLLSDSNNHTDLPFSIFSMTQEGIDHTSESLGNQDAGCIYISKKLIIGAVSDGCTGGMNLIGKSSNQVGAHIGSFLAVKLARKLLIKNRVPLFEMLLPFEQALFSQYRRIFYTLRPWKTEREVVIRNFLLSTIIFFAITDDNYIVAHCGDGNVIINSQYKDLISDSGHYFASGLTNLNKNEKKNYKIEPELSFKIVETGSTASLTNLFISTDGFLDNDIKDHFHFEKFFLRSNGVAHNSGFVDRKKEFRSTFLPEILKMKSSRIWPNDDATFISVKRVEN